MEGSSPQVTPLEIFYQQLWACDVKKDHGAEDFDSAIVKGLLPNSSGILETILDKEDLFNTVCGNSNFYNNLTSSTLQEGETGDIQQVFSKQQYVYKVFDNRKDPLPETIASINDFLTTREPILKITDTAAHSPELLVHLPNTFQAYTRETEIDPAGKSNPVSVVESIRQNFTNKFYVETQPIPHIVEYPAYTTSGTGLSEFYCNRNVFLHHTGIRDPARGTLGVELHYQAKPGGDTTIKVHEEGNIAKCVQKLMNCIKRIAGIDSARELKEMVFLSKHHGDIAQVLAKYRNISLDLLQSASNRTNTPIRSLYYTRAFESQDLNAVTKALCVNTDIIFYFPPGHTNSRLVIFKNRLLDTSENRLEGLKSQCIRDIERFTNAVLQNNSKMESINARKQAFDALAVFPRSGTNQVEQYKSILRKGVQIAILCKYLPTTPLTMVSLFEHGLIERIQGIQLEGGQLSQSSKTLLERTLEQIHSTSLETLLPTSYYNDSYNVLTTDGSLQPVKLEKELIFSITGAVNRGKPKVSLDDGWNLIDLGKTSLTDVTSNYSRLGAKFTSWWAIETIMYVYTNIVTYKKEIADNFLTALHAVLNVNGQKPMFEFLLSLTGITWTAPAQGGGRNRTYSAKKKRRNRTARVQRGGVHVLDEGMRPLVDNIVSDINMYFTLLLQASLENTVEFKESFERQLEIEIDTNPPTDTFIGDEKFASTFSVFPAYTTIIHILREKFNYDVSGSELLIQRIYELDAESDDKEGDDTASIRSNNYTAAINTQEIMDTENSLPIGKVPIRNKGYNRYISKKSTYNPTSRYGLYRGSTQSAKGKSLKRKARKTSKK